MTKKVTEIDQRLLIECAILAGVSALFAVLMNKRFARYKPAVLVSKDQPVPPLAVVLDKSTPQEKELAEPARQALQEAIGQVDSPEKADQVVKKLEEMVGSATIAEVQQTEQPALPARVSDKVAEKSQRIAEVVNVAKPDEKAAKGLLQTATEITNSPGRESAALSETTQETLNPEQDGVSAAVHSKQREYLRQAVLKRMKPFDALDAWLFLTINHLPHNRWLNRFFSFFTIVFKGGLGWYLILGLAVLVDPPRGLRAIRNNVLPLSVASSVVELPTKSFFRRRRPFIDIVHATVIGKKPGSWSFPSGHSASTFAGAWLLSRDYPRQRPLFFLLAGLVGFSRTYLGDHYPGDVLAGALSGMAVAELTRQAQDVVLPE